MAPLLRGRFASKGSGEDPEGDLSPPGMRRSSPCGNAGLVSTARARRQVRSKRAPCKRQNGPAFAGPYRAKGKWRESGGRSPSPGYAQKQPLRPCRSCHRRRARAPCKQKKRPRFCGAVLRQREAERIRRAISFARVCAEAAPAAMPVMPSTARPSAARSEAPAPLASGKTAPLLQDRIAPKGSGESPEGDLSPPGMRRSSPCGRAGLAFDGAPVRRQVRSKRAPCKRQNGPAFAGPFCVKGKRRGSGGRFPSPGCWTRPAPASRPGRRRSRPGGHPRRQSR